MHITGRYPQLQRTKSRSPAAGTGAAAPGSSPSSSGEFVCRSSSNPESLSADEARRRMLNWRKATTFRTKATGGGGGSGAAKKDTTMAS